MGARSATPPALVVADRAGAPARAGARAGTVGAADADPFDLLYNCGGIVPACYYLAGAAAGLVAGSRSAWQTARGKRPLRRPIMQSPIRYKVRLVDFLTAPVVASRTGQTGASRWGAVEASRGDGAGRPEGGDQSPPATAGGKGSPPPLRADLGGRASPSHSYGHPGSKGSPFHSRGEPSGKASPPLVASVGGRTGWSSAVEARPAPARRPVPPRPYQQQYQQALAGAGLAREGRSLG